MAESSRYKGRAVDLEKLILRPTRKERWGGWELQANYVLVHNRGGRLEYEIDLERCSSSAQVLDWIMQVGSKTWATPEIVGTLVQGFRDVLNPQGTLCGCGAGKFLDRTDVREMVDCYLKRPLEKDDHVATRS